MSVTHDGAGEDKPHGTLRLKTSPFGEMVCIEIWNDGPGIPPDIISRIFEPFYTTKPPGKGLGLWPATTPSTASSPNTTA